MRLFFLLFLLTLNSFSQRITLGPRSEVRGIVVDSLNNQLKVFFPGYYNTIDLTTYESKTSKFYYMKDREPAPDSFTTTFRGNLIIDGVIYFVNDGGGLVYALENDTLKRIDQSFDHKMQIGSTIFSYKSKIYKFGGYVFWAARNFFTYYDMSQNEWEVVAPINSTSIPHGMMKNTHFLHNDEIYFFDGGTINPYNRFENLHNEEVWKFNLKKNEWKYLGKDQFLHKNPNALNFSSHIRNQFKYKNKLVIVQQREIDLVDFINNKLTMFSHNYNKSSVSQKMVETYMAFYLHGKIFCFYYDQNNNILDQKVVMEAVSAEDFFGKKVSEQSFYKNTIWYGVRLALAIVGIVIIVITIFIISKLSKNRNKVRLWENGLRLKNKFTEFDAESMQIIKLLLSRKRVPSHEILKIVESPQYSAAHNERIKVQKLNEINLKVQTLSGQSQDFVTSVKSDEDKRIRVYSIRKDLFMMMKKREEYFSTK